MYPMSRTIKKDSCSALSQQLPCIVIK